ncbi:hypothetical protein [Polyangium sp. 6x1]|uniref:hypothetical protein n=1 Tax=Polyangium sp. 6x1 TaxID=3042689 RepID=UPI002482F58E|nr:hypothetical protein [Polyangium sp. 6x1]MDI1443400.1 hypothetical protein [Polyangium sp. 6x1]
MKWLRYTLSSLVLSSALALAGCGGNSEPEPSADPIADDEIVDLGDLIQQDQDAAAAAEVVGDPATLLAEGKKQGDKVRSDVAAVMSFIKEAAQGEPARKGVTADGRAYAQWVKTIQGAEITFSAVRMTQDRLRYLVQGKASDGAKKPLLTGIFVKKGPKTGGGRFHVNLSNVSDLYNAPGADGSVHFWFANHKGDKRGRRIAYLNVVRRDDPQMQKVNYGADLVRLVGVGGRFRSVGVGDVIPDLPGNEAIGLRILWKAGEGGRAVAAVASLGPDAKLLGTAHECWDKEGLRSAYKDDNPSNDETNPDEGDLAMCAGFAEEAPPDQADVNENGQDTDPELDALLEESGAMDIDAAEADAADAIGQ